jgi:outer membrane immunogenic protein
MIQNSSLALLTAITIGTTGQTAWAADMPVRAPIRPATVVFAYNWTGVYIGGFVGGAWGGRDASSTEPCAIGFAAPGCSYNIAAGGVDNINGLGASFIGGATMGYDWQAPGSPWVFGLEGEVGYLNLNSRVLDINSPAGASNGFDNTRIGNVYGVIAGRLGFAFNRTLFYMKGGAAFVQKHYDFTDNCVAAPCGPNTLLISRDSTDVTWAAGGGLEYAFSNNWSIKGEYLYLATRETFSASGIRSDGLFTYNITHSDPGVHAAKLGVNYRFSSSLIPDD